MSLIFYVLTDLIHVVNILLLCEMFFGFKKREVSNGKFVKILVLMIIMAISISIFVWDNDIIESIIYVSSICGLLIYFYEEKIITTIISTLWIVVLMAMLDTMSMILFDIISGIIGYNNTNLSKWCGAATICLFIFVLGKMYKRKHNRAIRILGVGSLLSFTILTAVDTFIVMVIALITKIEERVTAQVVYFIAFILVILGLFLQLGAVILILMQRNIYKETQQLTTRYLEDQKNHYEYLEKREIETKKFRHDIRSHMDMLTSLAREHRYNDFDEYVEKINMKVDKFGNKFTVQNTIVDAIINKFYSEAKKNDVKMSVAGVFPADCIIHIYDLCTIFSNLLSNALEAAVDSMDKWISVRCRYTDKVIVVEIMNSFDSKERAGNGRFKTRKADKNNHGFGLINVEESIEKYNGVWYIDQEDNVYKVTISFIYARMEGKNEVSNN